MEIAQNNVAMNWQVGSLVFLTNSRFALNAAPALSRNLLEKQGRGGTRYEPDQKLGQIFGSEARSQSALTQSLIRDKLIVAMECI